MSVFEIKQKPKPPHVERAEIVTSLPDGKHQIGKPLEIRFRINHRQPMLKACFSFTLSNISQANVIHARAFHPEFIYGTKPGYTDAICRFPSLRLGPGRYFVNTNLTETPGGEVYERLQGICSFEVIAEEEALPDAGVYQEDFHWGQD